MELLVGLHIETAKWKIPHQLNTKNEHPSDFNETWHYTYLTIIKTFSLRSGDVLKGGGHFVKGSKVIVVTFN